MTDPAFANLLAELRPRLHRYCARMVGSALDGEDLVQDTLAKAVHRYEASQVRHAQAWLFRIARNTALDFLRQRRLDHGLFAELADEDLVDAQAADPQAASDIVRSALATFMQLPPLQRSAVILADVLEHSLEETAEAMETTVPAVKAALHRGRTRLRALAAVEVDAHGALTAFERERATHYASLFNARDFDALRAMLADDARLDLAGRHRVEGKARVGNYFRHYAGYTDVRAVPACVEGRPGLTMHVGDAARPAYAVVLAWRGGDLVEIRDFRYAGYVMETLAVGPA
jgi:RNA polymerase sigma-70 factor (ECF subfamily)